eukprot:Rhum_TRINITY_DN14832_c2_g1::Rhum_TRINITY_DN14832_c2_g1_i1::g.124682::m.124682
MRRSGEASAARAASGFFVRYVRKSSARVSCCSCLFCALSYLFLLCFVSMGRERRQLVRIHDALLQSLEENVAVHNQLARELVDGGAAHADVRQEPRLRGLHLDGQHKRTKEGGSSLRLLVEVRLHVVLDLGGGNDGVGGVDDRQANGSLPPAHLRSLVVPVHRDHEVRTLEEVRLRRGTRGDHRRTRLRAPLRNEHVALRLALLVGEAACALDERAADLQRHRDVRVGLAVLRHRAQHLELSCGVHLRDATRAGLAGHLVHTNAGLHAEGRADVRLHREGQALDLVHLHLEEVRQVAVAVVDDVQPLRRHDQLRLLPVLTLDADLLEHHVRARRRHLVLLLLRQRQARLRAQTHQGAHGDAAADQVDAAAQYGFLRVHGAEGVVCAAAQQPVGVEHLQVDALVHVVNDKVLAVVERPHRVQRRHRRCLERVGPHAQTHVRVRVLRAGNADVACHEVVRGVDVQAKDADGPWVRQVDAVEARVQRRDNEVRHGSEGGHLVDNGADQQGVHARQLVNDVGETGEVHRQVRRVGHRHLDGADHRHIFKHRRQTGLDRAAEHHILEADVDRLRPEGRRDVDRDLDVDVGHERQVVQRDHHALVLATPAVAAPVLAAQLRHLDGVEERRLRAEVDLGDGHVQLRQLERRACGRSRLLHLRLNLLAHHARGVGLDRRPQAHDKEVHPLERLRDSRHVLLAAQLARHHVVVSPRDRPGAQARLQSRLLHRRRAAAHHLVRLAAVVADTLLQLCGFAPLLHAAGPVLGLPLLALVLVVVPVLVVHLVLPPRRELRHSVEGVGAEVPVVRQRAGHLQRLHRNVAVDGQLLRGAFEGEGKRADQVRVVAFLVVLHRQRLLAGHLVVGVEQRQRHRVDVLRVDVQHVLVVRVQRRLLRHHRPQHPRVPRPQLVQHLVVLLPRRHLLLAAQREVLLLRRASPPDTLVLLGVLLLGEGLPVHVHVQLLPPRLVAVVDRHRPRAVLLLRQRLRNQLVVSGTRQARELSNLLRRLLLLRRQLADQLQLVLRGRVRTGLGRAGPRLLAVAAHRSLHLEGPHKPVRALLREARHLGNMHRHEALRLRRRRVLDGDPLRLETQAARRRVVALVVLTDQRQAVLRERHLRDAALHDAVHGQMQHAADEVVGRDLVDVVDVQRDPLLLVVHKEVVGLVPHGELAVLHCIRPAHLRTNTRLDVRVAAAAQVRVGQVRRAQDG